MQPVRRAILSVSDKTGIVDLGKELTRRGIEIISTGGTARVLADGGVALIPIREVTGNRKDEYFSGRMKTISFNFESALLFDRESEEHRKQAEELGIQPIDLVICNLYPFEETIAKPHCTLMDAIENIDIGGPCMVRAGAKNMKSVAVISDPAQYAELLSELEDHDNCLSEHFKLRCSHAAFALTASYDQAIARYLSEKLKSEPL